MTLKPCTSDYMISTVNGMGMSRSWFPRIVQEAFLESTRDGEIQRAPDPVTMIDGDLTWFNNFKEPQMLMMQIIRAPRSVVSQSPNTVLIHDAWTWDITESPVADYPSVFQDSFGGKLQVDRPSAAAADLAYARFFLDSDRSQKWEHPGLIEPGESIHFRYLTAVQTPGIWTTATEFEPRWEASARWVRLLLFATPVGST